MAIYGLSGDSNEKIEWFSPLIGVNDRSDECFECVDQELNCKTFDDSLDSVGDIDLRKNQLTFCRKLWAEL